MLSLGLIRASLETHLPRIRCPVVLKPGSGRGRSAVVRGTPCRRWRDRLRDSPPPAAVPKTAGKGKQDQCSHNGRNRNNNVLVIGDPAANLIAERGAQAVSVGAFAATFTGGAIQEVLLHAVADIGAEFWRRAREHTALGRARVRVITRCQAAH